MFRLSDGRLSLDRQRCWADVWEVEAILRRLSALLDAAQAPATGEELERLGDRLCALRTGAGVGPRVLDRLRSLTDDDRGPIAPADTRRLPDIGLARASIRR